MQLVRRQRVGLALVGVAAVDDDRLQFVDVAVWHTEHVAEAQCIARGGLALGLAVGGVGFAGVGGFSSLAVAGFECGQVQLQWK